MRLRSLYPRIFLSFWIASTLLAAAFVVIQASANPPERIERRRNLIRDALRLEARAVIAELERGTPPEARLARFRERTDASIYLFADDGRVIAPKTPPAPVRELAARVRREGELEVERDNAALAGFRVEGTPYVAVGRVRRTPAWARELGTDTLALRLFVIALVAGIVALVLARYLTRPLMTLRRATQRIAGGDLSARVTPELGASDRELAALGRDFDRMAARVEELVVARERLLTDVSHELSSPIARLRVALELARKRAGPDAAAPLDRIEREAERLGALVDEILTLSRLDARGAPRREPIDLAALLVDVARDADFEAQALGARVRMRAPDALAIEGDPEVLRRALENVIRNAVRFTAEGTRVEVGVMADEAIEITVRDHGPGVPDDELARIFEPLHRVAIDRDRKTGGAGLGLAIAERAVRVHGGAIRAENAADGGLLVTIRLPPRR